MEQKQQQAGRQMRFTEQELSLIKNTFKGNTELLKLMRKVFLPEIDPKAPLGQIIDLWMVEANDIKGMEPETAYLNILARNKQIMLVESCLNQLYVLAETDAETPEEKAIRQKKDSLK